MVFTIKQAADLFGDDEAGLIPYKIVEIEADDDDVSEGEVCNEESSDLHDDMSDWIEMVV